MTRPRVRPAAASSVNGWHTRPPARPALSNASERPQAAVAAASFPVLDVLCPAFGFFASARTFALKRNAPHAQRASTSALHMNPNDSRSTRQRRPSLLAASNANASAFATRPCSCASSLQHHSRPASSLSAAQARQQQRQQQHDGSSSDDDIDALLSWSLNNDVWAPPPQPPRVRQRDHAGTGPVKIRPGDKNTTPPLHDPSTPTALASDINIWLDQHTRGLVKGVRTVFKNRDSVGQHTRDREKALQQLPRTLQIHEEIAQRLVDSVVPVPVTKHDLRRFMFAPIQLVRNLSVSRSDLLKSNAVDAEIDDLSRIVGQTLMYLVHQGVMAGDDTVASIVWLEGATLAARAPQVPWTPKAVSTSPELEHLQRVFCSGSDDTKYRQYRLTLLQHLFSCWSSQGKPDDALRLVFGWSVDDLLESTLGDNIDGLARTARRQYGETVARLKPSPSRWLDRFAEDDKRLRPVGLHLVKVLATTSFGVEALNCWNVLQTRTARFISLEDEADSLTVLVEGLVRAGYSEDATGLSSRLRQIIAYFDPTNEQARSAATRAHLRLAAERGDVEGTTALAMESRDISPTELLARQAATASKARDVVAVEKFVRDALANDQLSPTARARLYGLLITAHARRNDLESAQRVLDEMNEQGLRPASEHIAAMLYGYAARHDVENVYDLFRKSTTDLGIAPDVLCFNALVTVHCRLQDIAAAEGAIQRMRDVGVEPDLRSWTTLMNACVEIGDWAKAARIYAFLDTADDARLRPDTATFNVALKAAIYSSASVQSVLRLFRQMTERGLRPNSSTYALVMQSVCNAGIMDVAEDLFRSIDSSTKSDKTRSDVELPVSMKPVKPDVFHFSCLASGYIRTGQMTKARACLAEMRRRGIGPSSVTYGIIVDSFLRVPTKTNAERASKFAMDFISSSPLESVRYAQAARLDRALARGDELVNVFSPILRNHVRRGNAEVALATFKVVLEAGAKPSIELYTILLDAYRQGPDAQESARNVLTVWRGVHESVLAAYGSSSSSSEQPPRIDSSQAHALCLPFNIVMDALSRADQFTVVEQEWQSLDREGFAFDCANWNSFATLLVESDRIERACWIVENVLLQSEGEGVVGDEKDETVGRKSMHAPAKMPSRGRRTATKAFDEGDDDRFSRLLSLANELAPGDEQARDRSDDDLPVVDQVVRAQQARIGQLWFPYAHLLSSLDEGLQKLASSSAESQARLIKMRDMYPRAVDKAFEWARGRKRASDQGQWSGRRAFVV
ncbi:hypothetical protein ACM66B_000610 [Microbotryomycetes sp. NB124-2]